MATVNWGEIRQYTFKPPDKRRPVLVLTRSSAIEYLNEVTIAPITSTIRDIPTEVLLTLIEGMSNDCVVNLDYIQTIPKARLGRLITTLSSDKMTEVKRACLFALGFV